MLFIWLICLAWVSKMLFFNFNKSEDEFKQITHKLVSQGVVECPLNLAHNIIYGAIDFAEENGIKTHKDFKIMENILDADLIDEGIDEVEFSISGKAGFIGKLGI